MTATVVEATTTELVNKHSTSWPKWPYDWAVLWVLICTVHLTVCCCHVTYAFQSESKLYICLNIKELFPRNRHKIWSLNDSKGTWIHKQLVCKETLNLLAKLTEWSSWIVSTYLYGAFAYLFLSCHGHVSKWIHTLYLPECRGTFSKQARYLKFKLLQGDSSPQPFS